MSNDYLIILTLKKFVNSLHSNDFTYNASNTTFFILFCAT